MPFSSSSIYFNARTYKLQLQAQGCQFVNHHEIEDVTIYQVYGIHDIAALQLSLAISERFKGHFILIVLKEVHFFIPMPPFFSSLVGFPPYCSHP